MKFLSVCSGIEAASVAWNPLGWKAAAFSEIEPFPCSVLTHHYPDVPNRGDMTKFKDWPDHAIDLLCGGTPCQSFSVAGLRAGLDDPRGNLMLTFGAIAAKYRPRWLVWENVPGVLSSNGGRDFGSFLGLLGQLGYGFAYRVLDAQYFGLAQRRRRVFVVGCLGDWRSAAAVLFERHSLSGHPAPSRKAGERPAGSLVARAARNGGGSNQDVDGNQLVAFGGNNRSGPIDVATARNACASASASGRMDFESETFLVSHSLRGEGFDASEDGTGRGTPLVPVAQPYTLAIRGRGDSHNLEYRTDGTANALLTPNGGRGGIGVGAIAFSHQAGGTQTTLGYDPASGLAPCLNKSQTPAIAGMQVRRLTPRECARLQGFPDDYLDITYRGKPAADGPKYKALGNSWAVSCARWIGERIAAVDAMTDSCRRAA